MEVASRSAPMKMQPSFRAANAALAWLSIRGSQITCPGRANRARISSSPGVVQFPLPAGRGARFRGRQFNDVVPGRESETPLPVDQQ